MIRLGPPEGFWDGPRKRRKRRRTTPNGDPTPDRPAAWFQVADGRKRFLGVFLDMPDIDRWASRRPGRGFWVTFWRDGRPLRRWTLAVRLDGGVDWALIEARKGGRRGKP